MSYKGKMLIVIESKETGERFVHNPFQKGGKIVPDGYRKVTGEVPLGTNKFDDLPMYNS